MLGLTWLRGLSRRAGRLGATATGVAIAVALLASIGTFLSASKATMTQRAAQTVAVDWQVEVQAGANTDVVLAAVRSRASAALPVGFAQTSGFQATTGASTQTTGPGVVLGLSDTYRRTFPGTVRDLAGTGLGVLVAQQTAANLRVAPGDTITIGRAGLSAARVRVDGVVDLPQADSLFQKVGAPTGAQPQAPPDNVVLLPAATWHALFDPLAAARPDLIRTQIHARLSHELPHDPSAAYTHVNGAARNLEVSLAGAGLVGDNLAATLGAARSDALYAQVLFLFLGVPGAVLAGLLTGAVAASGATRRRHEQALLRTRGATTRTLVRIGLLEAAVVGVLGAILGIGVATIVGRLAFGSASFGATTTTALAFGLGAALVGVAIACLAITVPAWRDARSITVVGARRVIGRARAPRWLRLGFDLVALGLSGLVFWLTSRSGYNLVLAPEGTPSISVSYWALAGPALLWVGAGMLAWRVAYLLLGASRGFTRRLARPFSGRLAGTVGATMRRQRQLLASALALVALTVAFAASTAVFNATYKAQAAVDARLTNGADVTVTETPGAATGPESARDIAAVPGVAAVEPLQHRFAYVGADLQDLYGVRPSTIVQATKLQDAYFQGGTARDLISKLGAQPDGILLSAETVKDFQLRPGDDVRLRLRDVRSTRLVEVPFRYIGIAKEFPTAPRDSFLVANADYVARRTGSEAVGAFLVDTGASSPGAVAARLRTRLGTRATITDVTDARKIVGSSLTAVDLSGLTRVELGFAIVLASAATGLVLALGLAERRRTFAIVNALGAKPRQLGGFVWSEAAFIVTGGLLAGAIAGWALASMLVKVLTGVFDPPPAALSVPWPYLASVAIVATAAVLVAGALTLRRARTAPLTVLREL
ncbi:MAG: putative transport system permease protein [Actinomycetota bacterium]|nr:putative transport system permease protein [Actinomycetota bacterium]